MAWRAGLVGWNDLLLSSDDWALQLAFFGGPLKGATEMATVGFIGTSVRLFKGEKSVSVSLDDLEVCARGQDPLS